MSDPAPQLFVVERFDDDGVVSRLQPMPALPPGVRVVWAVCVPADDAVLALVEGSDEEAVASALAGAGWRVDRITPAARVQVAGVGPDPPERPATRTT